MIVEHSTHRVTDVFYAFNNPKCHESF